MDCRPLWGRVIWVNIYVLCMHDPASCRRSSANVTLMSERQKDARMIYLLYVNSTSTPHLHGGTVSSS
jgi:hypothetical protein